MQEPVTHVVLELGVGPIEVDVVDGGSDGAAVHQGPPVFGEEIPRGEAAAVLGLQESDLHDRLAPRVVATGLAYAIIPLRDPRALARAWFDRVVA